MTVKFTNNNSNALTDLDDLFDAIETNAISAHMFYVEGDHEHPMPICGLMPSDNSEVDGVALCVAAGRSGLMPLNKSDLIFSTDTVTEM